MHTHTKALTHGRPSLLHAARRWRAGLAVVCAMAVLAGCSTLSPKTPEEAVAERAQARWDAILKKDGEQMHSYMRPQYRTLHTVDETRKSYGDTLATSAKIYRTTCEEARCTVRVVLNVVNPALRTSVKTLDVVHEELWVREQGQWWFEAPVR